MSDLTVLKEAEGYVKSWLEHYANRRGGPVVLARLLRCTADEQMTNLNGTKNVGFQGTNGRSEWVKAVGFLDRAAKSAEEASDKYGAEIAANDVEVLRGITKRSRERRKYLRAKYPLE